MGPANAPHGPFQMLTLSRFFRRSSAASAAGRARPFNMTSLRERRRFRNSMPGESGACAAARLYGLGR
jgi:hypothetical protein